MTPRIGEPRCYDGTVLPVLYPGESASGTATINLATGEGVVTGWMVEPVPGWHGWWLRTRYRVWGRWFADGPTKLEGRVVIGQHEESS